MPRAKSDKAPKGLTTPAFNRMNLEDRIGMFFEENACAGPGDVRGLMTADALLAIEDRDVWTIANRRMDKSAVMALVVELLYEYPLTAILRMTGMPKPKTVSSWLDRFPSFRQAFESGERFRGLLRAEEAMEIADTATEKTAKSKKLQVDVRLRLAEAYDPKRFAKRTIAEDPNDLSRLTDREVEDKFMALLQNNKEALEKKLGVKVLLNDKGEFVGAVESASIIDSIPKAEPVAAGDYDIGDESL